MRNRNRIQILAEILRLMEEQPMKKTQIMYQCNLSYESLEKFINYLLSVGLLTVLTDETGKRLYDITPKGKQYLSTYRLIEQLSASLEEIEKQNA